MKKTLFILLCLPLLFSCENLINQNKMENNVDDGNQTEKTNYDDIKVQKKSYIDQIKSDSTELHKLQNNPNEQEKFAREKFLMKKENEDIFIIREKENE